MRKTLKIFGILLMGLVLVTSCGKDEDNQENEGGNNKANYKVTTVSDMLERCERADYMTIAPHNGGLTKITESKHLNKLKDLLTKDKVYDKFEVSKEEMEQVLSEALVLSTDVDLAFSLKMADMDNLMTFKINAEKNFVLCYTYDNNVYFKLKEGSFDIDAIKKVCVDGVKASN